MTALPGPPLHRHRIEVLLCTYNGERFVAEQIDSILRQTRAVDVVSVYDDASADRTVDALRSKARDHAVPVHITVHPRNLGYGANFWQAVKRSSGDVLVFCDQDDIWHPRKIERLCAAFDADDCGLVFSDGSLIDERGDRIGTASVLVAHGLNARALATFDDDPLRELLRRNCVNGAAAAVAGPLARSAPDLPAGMPHDQWLAMWCCASGWRLRCLPEQLYGYRQHGANAIGIGHRMWRHDIAGGWRNAWRSRERDRWLAEQFATLAQAAQVAGMLPQRPGPDRAWQAQLRLGDKQRWLQALVDRRQPRLRLAARIAFSLLNGSYRRMATADMAWRDLVRLVRP